MDTRLVRRIALALVALSALAAVLASTGVAASRQPTVARSPFKSGASKMNALRARHHLAPNGSAASTVALSPLESGVLADINALRSQHHLAPLRLSAPLSAAARAHTQEMAADGYFEHESADGTAFWKRIQAFYPQGGRSTWSVGENLLYAEPDIDAQGALEVWLNSPPHRAIMLKPAWREIGVAAVHAETAPGEYDGQAVTIVTADFGVRH